MVWLGGPAEVNLANNAHVGLPRAHVDDGSGLFDRFVIGPRRANHPAGSLVHGLVVGAAKDARRRVGVGAGHGPKLVHAQARLLLLRVPGGGR